MDKDDLILLLVGLITLTLAINMVIVPNIIKTKKTQQCINNPPENLRSYCTGVSLNELNQKISHSPYKPHVKDNIFTQYYFLGMGGNYYDNCIKEKCS